MIPRRARDSDEIDTLLARGRMGGAAREEVLSRVLDAHARQPLLRKSKAQYWAPALAAAAAFVLFFTMPPATNFTPKGRASTAPNLVTLCANGESRTCRIGGTLVFQVEDLRIPGFLAAWAEPAAGGERIWYFEGAGSVRVDARPGVQTLNRAVHLGPEQAPGDYVVHVVLTRAPLQRAALLASSDDVIAVETSHIEVLP